MWLEKTFEKKLTAGKLREFVNSEEFSKIPDNIPINMNIDYIYDCEETSQSVSSFIHTILCDDYGITFYNYI